MNRPRFPQRLAQLLLFRSQPVQWSHRYDDTPFAPAPLPPLRLPPLGRVDTLHAVRRPRTGTDTGQGGPS